LLKPPFSVARTPPRAKLLEVVLDSYLEALVSKSLRFELKNLQEVYTGIVLTLQAASTMSLIKRRLL
jgi:hypothetical protein